MSPDAPDYTLLSDVNVIGSVTLDVNVVGSVTINTNITGVESGVTFDVNITHSDITFDVKITEATVTLNVNITNEVLQSRLAKPALMFGDDGDMVDTGVDLIGANQSFTAVVWTKVLKTGFWGLIDEDIGGQRDWVCMTNDLDGVRVFCYDSTGNLYYKDVKDGLFSDREFHMAGIAYDYDNKKLYAIADGELIDTGLSPPDVADNGASLRIGWVREDKYTLRGIISRALVYNRLLSADEISQLHGNPAQPPSEGLILRYDFDEGSGSTVYDKSGGGHHGTIHGAVWVSEQGQVAPLLNVNLTASQITLNINITAQDIDIKIYTPSGRWVTGSDLLKGSSSTVEQLIQPGQEGEVFSATGRGRIVGIGFSITSVGSGSDALDQIRLRVYVDGESSPSIDLTMADIDMLNGRLLERCIYWDQYDAVVDSNKEFVTAKCVNPIGALTRLLYNRDWSAYQSVGGFLNVNIEFYSSVSIRVKDDGTDGAYVWMTVIYGEYP